MYTSDQPPHCAQCSLTRKLAATDSSKIPFSTTAFLYSLFISFNLSRVFYPSQKWRWHWLHNIMCAPLFYSLLDVCFFTLLVFSVHQINNSKTRHEHVAAPLSLWCVWHPDGLCCWLNWTLNLAWPRMFWRCAAAADDDDDGKAGAARASNGKILSTQIDDNDETLYRALTSPHINA